MLETHALQVFLEAARELNFTKAGQTLNLSQPAVSMQIRALEEYLAVNLFERDGRSLRLTKSGEALFPLAERLIHLVHDVEETIRASGDKVVGNLVIGSSAASAKYVLPPLMAKFRRYYPDVRVSILCENRAEVMDGLLAGKYDLAVTSLRLPGYDARYTRFFTDRLVLIVPASHAWARREMVTPQELLTERFICREPAAACRKLVREALAQLGVDADQMQIEMEIGTPEALAMAVEYGIGLSFVSLLAALPRLALGRLAIVGVEGLQLANQVELVQSCTRAASPVEIAFMRFVHHPGTQPFIEMLSDGHVL